MKKNYVKIAIADDDIDDHLFFEIALKEVNKEVVLNQYFDGRTLLDALTRPGALLPDIIFLDLNMPRKNGFQILEEIIRQDKLKNIPVVIMTTSLNIMDKKKAFDKGARLYTSKPSTMYGLVNLITYAFSLEPSAVKHEFVAEETGY